MVKVLGIDVDHDQLLRWRAWLMPERQPFLVPRGFAARHGWRDDRGALSFELLDAFELYGASEGGAVVWLTRSQTRSLAGELRRAQPTRHRWPTEDVERDLQRVVQRVESGRRSSRHLEAAAVWPEAGSALPGAARLAGTFPQCSGPNCFGAVMEAAGEVGAAAQWMQLEPFESWLRQATSPGGRDDDPGTVLVWRTSDGNPAHAAITLGSGWLLDKPSQGWMSPTRVLSARDGKLSARHPGQLLSRYQLTRQRQHR